MDLSLVGAVLPRPTTTTVGVNGNSSGNNEGNHHHGNALGNHDGRANHHGNVNVRLLKKYKYKRATRYRPASIATEAPLSAHVSQTQSFRCGDCNENFKSSTELLEHHARLHTFSFASCHFTAGTGNGTHPEMFCQQCSRSFANARAFEEHTRTHMALSHPHRCQICPPSHASAFTTEALLNAHVSSIHPFRCGDCNAHFDSPAGLLEHNTRLHTFSFTSCEFSAGTANGRLEPSQGTARFPCPQCAQEFLTDALRTQHLAVHRFESGPRESTTGGTSSREANNDVSSLTHALRAQNIAGRELGSVAHQSTNRGTTSGGANASLVCGECFEVSADAAALQEHINNCHLHICSFCQERVGSFREFEAHMLRKHSYYPCGICKLSFPHELARNLHTCPICTICKDSSPTMITLVHHMESTHHVFPCPYCLAHFQRPRNLTAHVENCPHRRLTDRHTYSCRVCGAFFDRQEELGRHVTRQHHPCTSCDAGPFGSVWALKEHKTWEHACPLPSCSDQHLPSRQQQLDHIRKEHEALFEQMKELVALTPQPKPAASATNPPPRSPAAPRKYPECRICLSNMGTVAEISTTRCGHIFCSPCIKTALQVRPLCPACRKGVAQNSLIRLYL